MKNDFWDYGAIVVDKDGNVAQEAVERYTDYEDHHGSATKRALTRLGITNISGTMGVEVAKSANELGVVVLHSYAPSLFVYSPSKVTPLQFAAIYSLLISRTDFDFIMLNLDKDLVFDRTEPFLNYLKTVIELDASNKKLR